MFLIDFVKLTETSQLATLHHFCVKAWHTNKNHSDMSKTPLLCACVKVAELWEWLTW